MGEGIVYESLPGVHKFYEIALHVGLKSVMVYAHLVEIHLFTSYITVNSGPTQSPAQAVA